ncbi:MAG: hypothetical protein IKQ71_10375 [Lachnospiraceae bacterium]|nr:hypothetical protein [Lachnospiraceae bacterium]
MDSVESFSKDKDISELLELLTQMKDRDGLENFKNTVSYVDSLEETLSAMMKQIVDMREEIKTVHEQNQYLMSRAERGVRDIMVDQLKKAEEKVQELHSRLVEVKNSLKRFASDAVKSAKMFGGRAILKLVDITHIKQALVGIRDRADRMAGSIDSLYDMVEGYKANVKREAERRAKPYEGRESATHYDRDDNQLRAVAEEQTLYQQDKSIGSYEEEMQRFMDAKVREGMTYECNQDAYEDFKAYYDKKLKAAGQAGKGQTAVSRVMKKDTR